MSYAVELSRGASKFINKLSIKDFKLVAKAIDSLASDPYQLGTKKLQAYHNTFRIRAGNFRIIYTVDSGKLVVVVVDIGDRKDIYN